MQKNIWQQLVAVIIFIWALWNYEITLSLLGSALGILMPLITGCVIAFTVNVFIEKLGLEGRFALLQALCLFLA